MDTLKIYSLFISNIDIPLLLSITSKWSLIVMIKCNNVKVTIIITLYNTKSYKI